MKRINKTIFYASFPLGFISLVFPIYAASFGARGLEIGLLYAIFSIISIAMRPIVGKLIDNKGRKLGILLGVFLYLMANLAFFIAKDLNWLLFARIIQSFGASFLWISIDTYIADISDINNRSTNYGIREQIASKGIFIGSSIGFTILLNNFGNDPFKIVFMIFSFTSILSLYFSFNRIKEPNYKHNPIDNNRLKKHDQYQLFLLIIFILSFINHLTTPIFLLYLQDYITRDLAMLTFIFIPVAVCSIFLPSKFGALADKYSREKIIVLALYLSAILQVFIPFIRSYNGFVILYTIISLTEIFYAPAFSSLVIDFIGEDKRGSSYGLYSFASGLGATFGPIVGAFIYEKVDNFVVFYVEGILLFVFISILCYIYSKKTHKRGTI